MAFLGDMNRHIGSSGDRKPKLLDQRASSLSGAKIFNQTGSHLKVHHHAAAETMSDELTTIPTWNEFVTWCGGNLRSIVGELVPDADLRAEGPPRPEDVEKAQQLFARALKWLHSLSFPSPAWRVVRVRSEEDLRLVEHLGGSWSVQEDCAQCVYQPPFKKGVDYLLEARIPFEAISLGSTIYWAMTEFFEKERELRLKNNATFELIGYRKRSKGDWKIPAVRRVTAREKEIDSADYDEDGFWAGDGNAASGILPIARDTGRICLAWRNAETHTGDCWGTIGGAVKEDTSPAESAKAEMSEEVGFAGAVELHPAFVFQSGAFRYLNFIGVVDSEFAFQPGKDHGWETDSLSWFDLDDLLVDMEENAGDYHPGLIALFEHSGDLIARLAGREQAKEAATKQADVPRGFKAPANVVSKEHEAVKTVFDWFTANGTDSMPWRDFGKHYQQYAQKYATLFTGLRGNRPNLTKADLQAYLDRYNGEDRYSVSTERYDDPDTSFREVEQLVLKINQGASARKVVGEDQQLYDYLTMLGQSSRMSGHPADRDTVGWLRVDFVDGDWLVIDEVQSDLVNSITQAKNILLSRNFKDYLSRLPTEEGREEVRSKIPPGQFPLVKRHFEQMGYTEEMLDGVKRKMIDLFEDWAEYAIATVLKIARDQGIGAVALHTAETIAARDRTVDAAKMSMYYNQLAKGFGFKKEKVQIEGNAGTFWVRHLQVNGGKVATPDFGYSHFNDRERALRNLKFEISPFRGSGFEVTAISSGKTRAGSIACDFYPNGDRGSGGEGVVYSSLIDIDRKWRGTGLGQLLYDKAIFQAKGKGARWFCSDVSLTSDATSAWSRLKRRYLVEELAGESYNPDEFDEDNENVRVPGYRIDLQSVSSPAKVAGIRDDLAGATGGKKVAMPNFGYSRFNDREEELRKLKVQVRTTAEGFLVSAIGAGYLKCELIIPKGDPGSAFVEESEIQPEWRGTGLGQILYMKAIQVAGQRGAKWFYSDTEGRRSQAAEHAWNRLEKRYHVERLIREGRYRLTIPPAQVKLKVLPPVAEAEQASPDNYDAQKQAALPPVEDDKKHFERILDEVRQILAGKKTPEVQDATVIMAFEDASSGTITANMGKKLLFPKEDPASIKALVNGGAYEPDRRLITINLRPGSGRTIQLAAKFEPDRWSEFAQEVLELLIHERTHVHQFRSVMNDAVKGGKSYRQRTDEMVKRYTHPEAIGDTGFHSSDSVRKYLSNHIEIAAWARKAVEELRSKKFSWGSYNNRSIYVMIGSRSMWGTMSTTSESFRRYYAVFYQGSGSKKPDQQRSDAMIFRRFRQQMIKALPSEDHRPVSKEDYNLAEELSPSSFRQDPVADAGKQAGTKGQKPRPPSFKDWMGEVKTTPATESRDLTVTRFRNDEKVAPEPFLGGRYQIVKGYSEHASGFAPDSPKTRAGYYNVLDGDKVIASMCKGSLVVDKAYRKQGIGQELAKVFMTDFPKYRPSSVTMKSKRLFEKAWEDTQAHGKQAAMPPEAFEKWIGCDLDGTLAVSLDDYSDPLRIGAPIWSMVRKVHEALEAGKTVKIMTARMADKDNAEVINEAIGNWTEEHVGRRLEATNEKTPGMQELWCDKARQVIEDTGEFAKEAADAFTVAEKVVNGVTRLTYSVDGKKVGEARLLGTTIGDIRVAERLRRQGFGRRILQDCIKRGGRTAIAGSPEGEALLRATGFIEDRPSFFSLPQAKEARPTEAKIKLLQEQMKLTDEQIEQIIETDPSPNQTDFITWIAKNVKKELIRLPEDRERIKGQLTRFTQLKRSPNFTGSKDINTYTPESLYTLTDTGAPVQLSRKDQDREAIDKGSTVVFKDDRIVIRKVTAPKALTLLSSATNWCTAQADTAKHYLQQGPSYVVYEDGSPYAQLHPKSNQYMDRSDVSFHATIRNAQHGDIGYILDELARHAVAQLAQTEPDVATWYKQFNRTDDEIRSALGDPEPGSPNSLHRAMLDKTPLTPEEEGNLGANIDINLLTKYGLLFHKGSSWEPLADRLLTDKRPGLDMMTYARKFMGGQWSEGDKRILDQAIRGDYDDSYHENWQNMALQWALSVKNGRWDGLEKEAHEEATQTSPGLVSMMCWKYIKEVTHTRWPYPFDAVENSFPMAKARRGGGGEIEEYLREYIKGPWPALRTRYIQANDVTGLVRYAIEIETDVDPLVDKTVLKVTNSKELVRSYMDKFHPGKWPELEEKLGTEIVEGAANPQVPSKSFRAPLLLPYVEDYAKGRVPEFEKGILDVYAHPMSETAGIRDSVDQLYAIQPENDELSTLLADDTGELPRRGFIRQYCSIVRGFGDPWEAGEKLVTSRDKEFEQIATRMIDTLFVKDKTDKSYGKFRNRLMLILETYLDDIEQFGLSWPEGEAMLDEHLEGTGLLRGEAPTYRERKQKTSALAREAAQRGIYFHGSSIRNLRSILSQGLQPDAKSKNFGTDSDQNNWSHSIETYGGVYVTQNLQTAVASPKDHHQEGRELIVCMELQPNTFFVDEDAITGLLSHPLGRLSDHTWSVLCQYVAAVEEAPAWKSDLDRSRSEFVASALAQIESKLTDVDKTLHSELEARLREQLADIWLPALARLAARAVYGYSKPDEYQASRAWTQVMGEAEYDNRPPLNELFVTREVAEADFRERADAMTRTLGMLARPDADGKQNYSSHARITEPIGYSGSNRIVAVLEVRDSRKYRGPKYEKPTEIIEHFGTVPAEFLEKWRRTVGDKFKVVKPGQDAAVEAEEETKVAAVFAMEDVALEHVNTGAKIADMDKNPPGKPETVYPEESNGWALFPDQRGDQEPVDMSKMVPGA